MNAVSEALLEWPTPITPKSIGGVRQYPTPEGPFPGVTTHLKVLGLGTEGLIRWSATEERKAVLAACAEVYASDTVVDGPASFAAAVEEHIGAARQHQRILSKAGDIGSAAHERVNWQLRGELGLPVGPEPVIPDESTWAWMAFDTFWKESGLRVVRTEQTVWDAELGAAGTIDIVAEDTKGTFGGGLGVLDLKTSKGVYESHHVQVAAYMHLGRRWADLRWGALARLPKNTDDPQFSVHRLGELYGGRKVSQEGLLDVFRSCVRIYDALVRPS